jgi:PAS domain S-box-containing protein
LKNQSSKFKEVFFWPEFQLIWALIATIVALIVINSASFANLGLWMIVADAALFLIIIALSALGIYTSAKKDRDTSVERNELNSILEELNDGLIVYEADFRVIFFNPAAERIFRLDAKAVVGHAFSPRDVEREGWRTLTQVVFPSLAPRVDRTHERERVSADRRYLIH